MARGIGIIPPSAVNLSHGFESRCDQRIAAFARLLEQGNGALIAGQRVRLFALRLINGSQTLQTLRHHRAVRPERPAPNIERPPVGTLGLVVVAQAFVERPELVQGDQQMLVVRAEHFRRRKRVEQVFLCRRKVARLDGLFGGVHLELPLVSGDGLRLKSPGA